MNEDLKYSLRQVRKNPRLLVLIVIILGAGIGANATIYSLVEAAGHLPIRDQYTIALLWSVNPGRKLDRTQVSAGDFADLKTRLTSLQGLAAFSDQTVHLQGAGEPVRLSLQRVTSNYFSVLGVTPAMGRDFTAEDSVRNEPAVILAHSAWQAQFGGDPGILGRTVQINGLSHKIIGVMRPEFQYLADGTALWAPMKEPVPGDDRTSRDLIAVGRLQRPGDMGRVQAQATALATQLAAEHPDNDAGWQFSLTGSVPVRRDEAIVLALALLLPFFVLAIACANIANIFLARSVGRQREIAVRLALGASRFRIVRLLLIESAMYSLVGGTAGVLAGIWGTDLARGRNFLWANARVDFPVLGASVLTALICGLIFGLAPALHTLRLASNDTLKRTSGSTTIDRKGRRLRSALMVTEVAAATLLLLLAGLVLRSVVELRGIDTGFRTDGVQTFHASILDYQHAAPPAAVAAHLAILESLRQLPGVQYAGAGTRVPTEGGRNNPTQQLEIEGRTYPDKQRDWAVDLTVTPGYFEALGVPLLRGRYFSPSDTASASPVVVIGLTTAKRYWNNEDPVGKRIRLTDLPDAPWVTVAGVVGDVRNDDAGAPPLPMLYLALSQHPVRGLTYVLQSSSSISTTAIRTAVERVEPGLPIYGVRTMQQILDDDLAGAYLTAGFLGLLGVIALSLAAIGIFGVLSHITSEHCPEIAIRMALGAEPRQVVWTFVGRALRVTAIGVVIGGAGASMAFRLMRSSLSETSVVDPVALSASVGVLLLVAAVACYLPARRATKMDPMLVLRHE